MLRIDNFDEAEFSNFEASLVEIAKPLMSGDPAHDLQHVARVAANARVIAAARDSPDVDPYNLMAAVWLHDIVLVDKSNSDRNSAGELAAHEALNLLSAANLNNKVNLDNVFDAIRCHNFSAGLDPSTNEGLVLQDSDRLDAIGAIGVARCFSVSAKLGASFYHDEEIIPNNRNRDDKSFSIDHFYAKLFGLSKNMNTPEGRRIAETRNTFMTTFIEQLMKEAAGEA